MRAKVKFVHAIGALALGSSLLLAVSPRSYASTPTNTASYTDQPGSVYDTTSKMVSNYEQADAKTATISDRSGQVNLSFNTYQQANPSTDPGWQTNTPSATLSYIAWAIVSSSGDYIAYFFTNGTPGQPSGTLGGLLTEFSSTSQVPVSCTVTPSFSPTAGYQLSFSTSCIGSPSSFQWYSYIVYHPSGTPSSYFVGKDAPEEPVNPTQATFGDAVYAPTPVTPTGIRTANGYNLVATDGGVFSFGGAQFYGSTGGIRLRQPIVGMAMTPDSHGYWLVASDGGVFAFGDAHFYGSTGGIRLKQPVVAIASTPDGAGYWLVASDGGVFAFGDASFHGSTGGIKLNKPVVSMAPTADGAGYWLVASDGGVFAFGTAAFHGSLGAIKLKQPIEDMSATSTGDGYLMLAADGGLFAFGDAKYFGSGTNEGSLVPFTSIATSPGDRGYWLATADGHVYPFGDAVFYGGLGNTKLRQPIVGIGISTTSS